MFQAAAQEISEPSFTPSRIDELIQTAALKPVCSSDNEEPFVGAKFNLRPSRRRGCIISKGRKRRAFAIDGPLATPDLRGDNVLSNEPAMFFYSSDRRMSEKLIASSRQDNSGPADDKSQEQAWPLPPCSSRRTPMMTPHQDLVSSPVTNELSRFGSLALQSPSSCFSAFSPGRTRSVSINDQSPSIGNHSSSPIPRQAQRIVPIAFVGSDKSNIPRTFARNKCPPDSPANFAFPKPRLAPRPKDNKKSTGLYLSPRFWSGLPCEEMTPPIAFLDLGKIKKDAAAGETAYNHQSLLSSSNEVDDYAFVFNDASDGSLTDDGDGDEGDWFLCGPDKELIEQIKKAKYAPFSSPCGVDVRRSTSFDATIFLPTRVASTGDQANSYVDSKVGMGIVHEHSDRTLRDDMEICSFRLNQRTVDSLV